MRRTEVTDHHACFLAHELSRRSAPGAEDQLATALFDSRIDLNPHQVEAALFALEDPLRPGVVLADEVGLGKTIEAGLVLCQLWAEQRRRLIVVAPAHLRKQWEAELREKFHLPAVAVDRKIRDAAMRAGRGDPLRASEGLPVISLGFAAAMKDELRAVPFDLVVIDEAHKLRNAYQPSRKGGQAVRWAFAPRRKVLLTATPLQNSLLELYGLGWLIDEHLFGDRAGFQRRYAGVQGDLDALRDRLAGFCRRTLRRDCVGVRYTRRLPLTQRFTPTPEEARLQEDVRHFAQREVSFALPERQRHLVELILFKTLASSPEALAGTLRTIRGRLVDLRDGLVEDARARFTAAFAGEAEDAGLDVDLDLPLGEEHEIEDPGLADGIDEPELDASLLAEELRELDTLLARAEGLRHDSKAEALLEALRLSFARMDELGAPAKALVFTESRRTQRALVAHLEARGYAGEVVPFDGGNTGPQAAAALERFRRRHAGTDRLAGSRAMDVRSALVEDFRDRARIMVATEAASEGVNLQFCSLVVNYDLPWNPQRVEQRIGRCHRYGQAHDVVVVNLLNDANPADRRVQELLQDKFNLFDGLFGASDEVLGNIGDVDLPRRILSILKDCRDAASIEAAFDVLQEELKDVLEPKMADARAQLLEHFDADVHERLRVDAGEAGLALDRVGRRLWRLARWGLADRAHFDENTKALDLPTAFEDVPAGRHQLGRRVEPGEHLLRVGGPLGAWLLQRGRALRPTPAALTLDLTGHGLKVSSLEPLRGTGGWLRLDLLSIEADAAEEHLLATAITDEGANLDSEVALRLLDLDAVTAEPVEVLPAVADRLEADAGRASAAALARAAEAGNVRLKAASARIDAWADDVVAAAEAESDKVRLDLRAARRAVDLAENAAAQEEATREVARLEKARRRARNHLEDTEDQVAAKRSDLLRQLADRCRRTEGSRTLLTLRWSVV